MPGAAEVVKALRLYDDDVRQCFIECTTQTMVGNRPNLVQVEVDLDCIAYRTTLQQHILFPSQPLTVVPTLITIFYNLYNTTIPLFHWLRLFQWKQFWLELLDHQKDLPSKLENHQFRLLFQSLLLHLGSISTCPAQCPFKIPARYWHHATTCKRGGDVVFRHNKLRDILAETCRRAHLSVQVEAGCNLTPDHSHSRPADVLISNWVLGKTAACDLSVTSPLNSNIMSEAGVTAGAAAQATELRKHEANDVKCSELGWLCIPLVVESYGAWGKEAMESFSSLASRLAITSTRPKSAVLSELYGRLNLNLVRANVRAIMSRYCPLNSF
eukprot:Em0023g816a